MDIGQKELIKIFTEMKDRFSYIGDFDEFEELVYKNDVKIFTNKYEFADWYFEDCDYYITDFLDFYIQFNNVGKTILDTILEKMENVFELSDKKVLFYYG